MQNSLIRFGIAILLAAGAGIGNYVFMNKKQAPAKYVTFTKNINIGETLDANSLGEVEITGKSKDLTKGLIAGSEKSSLYGRKAHRAFSEGTLALQGDFERQGPEWQVLGPFKLLSVGERIREGKSLSYSDGSGGRTVTIAVKVRTNDPTKEVYEPIVKELLDILYRTEKTENQVGKIVAIQIYNSTSNVADSDETMGELQPLDLDDDERGLIVPLSNIETIPEVLVRGTQIGFVVKR